MSGLKPAILLTSLLSILVATLPTAQADNESSLKESGSTLGLALAGGVQSGGAVSKVYIVQLKSPAATAYQGTIPGLAATKAAPGQRFSKQAAGVERYTKMLGQQQERVLAKAGPGVKALYSYRYSLNGFAASMTPMQANKVRHLPEVLQVWEDEVRPLATNFSPSFLGLPDAGNGLRGGLGLSGEDQVIGVIDSGITPEHPALADTREADRPRLCRSSWGETSLLGRWLCRRFTQRADVVNFEPPVDWAGECAAGDRFTADDCNNKLIGARFFVSGAQATGPIDDQEIFSARDADGHGTHIATTAAGNEVEATIFGTFIGDIEGMAPRARVAVYKACWLRPGDTRASCNTSDLAQAIDAAVADGVDVINYSVGNTMNTLVGPDDLALLGAAQAGVFSAVAAGNEGPNFGTVGSPAGGPWVLTVAASSRSGQQALEALQVNAPAGVAAKYAVQEASFTPRLLDRGPIDAELVLVDDADETLDDGSVGTTFDGCETLINSAEVSGKVAFIQRGGCEFETKIVNAETAGAAAVLVFNIAGDPIVMTGPTGTTDVPALMIGQADGNLILDAIDAGDIVDLTLNKGLFLTENETGNVMGSFSGRGPGPVADILKPDVTAPGINILAGFSPDAANSVQGENYGYLSGTSMAAPHAAGVAALLREAHPEWSVAAIKSALQTTAYQDVLQADETTDAIPFDFGSGHMDPNAAADPGLVYDAGADDYDAFSCGIESPLVDSVRCDALAASGLSFDGSALNQPAIAVSRLASSRTIERRVTNVSDSTESYNAEIVAPPGISVSVVPPNLTLAPGATESFEVTFNYLDGVLDLWRFGSLTWRSADHAVRSPLAIRPISVTAPIEVVGSGGTGTFTFPVDFGYSGSYAPGVHGLNKPLIINSFVDNDPSKTFTFRSTDGVTSHLIDVPPNQAYIRFSLFDEFTDGNDDLDMFVFFCPDNVTCTPIGESGNATSNEQFDVLLPGAGRYAVLVHGFDTDEVGGGPGANYSLFAWSFGLVDDQGNLTADGPGFVNAGTTEDVTINWSGLEAGSIYLGGVSHNTPQGFVALTVVTIRN